MVLVHVPSTISLEPYSCFMDFFRPMILYNITMHNILQFHTLYETKTLCTYFPSNVVWANSLKSQKFANYFEVKNVYSLQF